MAPVSENWGVLLEQPWKPILRGRQLWVGQNAGPVTSKGISQLPGERGSRGAGATALEKLLKLQTEVIEYARQATLRPTLIEFRQ